MSAAPRSISVPDLVRCGLVARRQWAAVQLNTHGYWWDEVDSAIKGAECVPRGERQGLVRSRCGIWLIGTPRSAERPCSSRPFGGVTE